MYSRIKVTRRRLGSVANAEAENGDKTSSIQNHIGTAIWAAGIKRFRKKNHKSNATDSESDAPNPC